jgi:hypothetical protein
LIEDSESDDDAQDTMAAEVPQTGIGSKSDRFEAMKSRIDECWKAAKRGLALTAAATKKSTKTPYKLAVTEIPPLGGGKATDVRCVCGEVIKSGVSAPQNISIHLFKSKGGCNPGKSRIAMESEMTRQWLLSKCGEKWVVPDSDGPARKVGPLEASAGVIVKSKAKAAHLDSHEINLDVVKMVLRGTIVFRGIEDPSIRYVLVVHTFSVRFLGQSNVTWQCVRCPLPGVSSRH